MKDFKKTCLFSNSDTKRVIFEITNKCNLNCKHCCSYRDKETSELSDEKIIGIIKELEVNGIKKVYLSGGEPLLRKNILEILSEFDKRDISTILATNGTILNESIIDFLKNMKKLDLVHISLDDLKEEEHDFFRGKKGSFKKTVKTIKLLVKNKIKVRVGVIITAKNYDRLSKIVDFIKNFGVRYLNFIILQPTPRTLKHKEYLPKQNINEIYSEIKRIKDVFDSPGFEITFKRICDKELKMPLEKCRAGSSFFYIKCDGGVFLCPWLSKLAINSLPEIGNLKNDSFKDIINSSPVQDFLDYLNKMKFNEKCTDCDIRSRCGYGCPAMLNPGDSLDKLCHLAEL